MRRAPVGFPISKYGCRVSVADRIPPRKNKCLVRWTGYFQEVDASQMEVRAGLRVLFSSYLDAAGQLMALEPDARRAAIAELDKKLRAAVEEARTEEEEAPAVDVKKM